MHEKLFCLVLSIFPQEKLFCLVVLSIVVQEQLFCVVVLPTLTQEKLLCLVCQYYAKEVISSGFSVNTQAREGISKLSLIHI